MKQIMIGFSAYTRITGTIVAATCLALLLACSDQQSSEKGDALRALEAEVMQIHDDVMPRMSEINDLVQRLDSIQQNTDLDSASITKLEASRLALVEADSLMWAWMHAYSAPARDGDTSEIRSYLENEKMKISEVSEKMQSSITWAEQVVKRLTRNEKK